MLNDQKIINLFEKSKESAEEQIEQIRNNDIFKYRTRTIKSGNYLECEIYPVFKRGTISLRTKKANTSREAQERINERNSRKKLIRLCNANFNNGDIWATFGCDDEHLPKTWEEAKKLISRYIERLKYARKKEGLPDLKYIYVIEWKKEADEEGAAIRCHYHLIMSGDGDREKIEELWTAGKRKHTRRIAVDEYGLEGLARYMLKAKKHARKWGASKNLKQPIITISDTKITPKKADIIAKNENNAKEIFETIYPTHIFNDVEMKYSEFVPGIYIYARMRREECLNWKKANVINAKKDTRNVMKNARFMQNSWQGTTKEMNG